MTHKEPIDGPFTAEDFPDFPHPSSGAPCTAKHAADNANYKFHKLLGAKVVCRSDDGKWACDEHTGFARATHFAYLIGPFEISEEENETP